LGVDQHMMKRLALAFAFALALASSSLAQVPPSPGGTTTGVPITASSGNVAAATATATLAAGGANKITYICGFQATAGGATAAASVTLTVTNLVTGTMSFTYGAQTGVGVPTVPLVVPFTPCLPANAANTTIVVSMPSLGTGNTNATVSAWGFQR
jgi:large repetitive protein